MKAIQMPMYGYGFLIGIALVVIFWFLFVAPMERRMHERKVELMRRKLERNEQRLRELSENGLTEINSGHEFSADTDCAAADR